MGRTPMSGGSAFRFLPSEVADMEKALDASSGATPARSIVEGLAEKFTNSSERNGREVQWKQVWNWFQNRRHAQKAKIDKLKAIGSSVETPPAPKPVPVAGSSAVKKTIDVPMDFEAKSARDGAWYDVSAFISQRKSESGEPEVKVRFAGFGSEEDEWVNIATAVRQRSLPCETTECVAVLPGDLILCFQEGSEQALYFDADILDVQRRRHDVRGCRCRFWVRYRHDQTEEVVPLRKVCRRPETEQRLQLAREVSKLSNKDSAMDRPLNGTPNLNAPQIPPTTPATPATMTQLGTAFGATHLSGTSPNLYTTVQQGTITPGLQQMQPIPMQSLATPDAMASIHQQAAPQGATPVHAISSSQVPTPSMPITTAQSAIIQQLSTSFPAQPSIESSISRQLTISAPVEEQSRPINAGAERSAAGDAQQHSRLASSGVEPSVTGDAQQHSRLVTAGVEPSVTGDAQQHSRLVTAGVEPSVTGDAQQPFTPGVAVSEQHTTATTGIAETSNLSQPMEIVSSSSTPAVVPIERASAAEATTAAEVGLPSGSKVATAPTEVEKSLVTGLGEPVVPSVTAPVSYPPS